MELTYTLRVASVLAFLLCAVLGCRLLVHGNRGHGNFSMLLALLGLSSLALIPANGLPVQEGTIVAWESSTMYHRAGCRRGPQVTQFASVSEAVEKGMTPCPYCNHVVASR